MPAENPASIIGKRAKAGLGPGRGCGGTGRAVSILTRLMAPPGPVAGAFLNDQSEFPAIMGPIGSGKTTMCIARAIKATMWQQPGRDGVRRSRGVVIRDTYPQLWQTTIKSWQQWLPPSLGEWNGSAPPTHKLSIRLHRPADMQLEVVFQSIGDSSVEDVLRGSEWTWFWLNEADRLSPRVAQYLLGRLRWQHPEGGGGWYGGWADFNAPDTDNWTYKWWVDREALPDGIDPARLPFYRQPGARSPEAENLHNLPGGRAYYERAMMGASPDYVRRMIDNEFGAVRHGMPVWPEFRDAFHVAREELRAAPRLPLIVAADAGLTPAALLGQIMPDGQLQVLDEIVIHLEEEDQLERVGPRAFGRALKALLASRYPGLEVTGGCDPAGAAGTDGSREDRSWMQQVSLESGVRFRPAPVPNNSLTVRLEAVRRPLLRMLDGVRPGLLISPRCKRLRKALNSGYVYRRTALAGGDGRFENKPVKNQFSHVADALQYLCLMAGEGRAAVIDDRRAAATDIPVISDYDLFGDG